MSGTMKRFVGGIPRGELARLAGHRILMKMVNIALRIYLRERNQLLTVRGGTMEFFKFALWTQLGFWYFSTVMYILNNNDKWFPRACVASLFLCTLAIVKAIEKRK